MAHIHNGILLSHKKERIWVSSSEVDEPRACYTLWSKLERENTFHILMPIYEIWKNGIDEPICRAGIETQI